MRPFDRLLTCVFLFVLFSIPGNTLASSSDKLWRTPKKLTIRGRIVAQAPSLPPTSRGQNADNYLFELESKDGVQLVKLSFRFVAYEPRIPDDLFDYGLLHSFSAIRDKSCDESLTRLVMNRDSSPLKYASGAPPLQIAPDAVLPCYVVTPRDYKGSRVIRSARA